MSLIVQKFGGTSVGSIERIKEVAKRVKKTVDAGNRVAVVVSAMSGETNRLIGLVDQITDNPDRREYDQIVSTGEQVTIGLLSLALKEIGQPACSFAGHQAKIKTDSSHSKAKILNIETDKIQNMLDQGMVAVIAGFQGIDENGNITTLGRGGSDTSAVAIAAALKADCCEIYTDVDGVYTTDPRICKDAKKLKQISLEEMMELASQGAKVLQMRSVFFAAKYAVNLVVRSSFSEEEGTLICKEVPNMEDVVVTGIALDESEAKVSLRDVPDKPGIAKKIFGALANANVNVDMIVQNVGLDGFTDMTFTIPKTDLNEAVSIIKNLEKEIGFDGFESTLSIAKVSVVGVGMRSHSGVASKVFEALSDNNINVDMISTSEIRISLVVAQDLGKKAVQVLHEAFNL